MPRIFKDYLYQRYIEDILIYSFAPLLAITALAVQLPLLSLTFISAAIVNYLMYCFSFLYNDIEDRIEDANSPGKRFKNPFGYKVWSLEFGYALLAIMAGISLVLSYLIGGWTVVLIALTNLIAGIVYSSKWLRLKDLPLVDVITHCYLLAAAIVLYFMALPGAVTDPATWALLVSATLFSIGGDLLNEYRDFEDDRMAGLRNSAYYLGKERTRLLQRVMWTLAALVGIGGLIVLLSRFI